MIQGEEAVLAPSVCKPSVAQSNSENADTSAKSQSLEDSCERPKSEKGGLVVLGDGEYGNGVSRMRLQYTYSEDQWSPTNPGGKKQYDSEFLLQLQYSVLGQQKPAGMLDIPDIVFDKPHTKPQQEKDFVPRYKWGMGQGGGAQKTLGSPIEPTIPEHHDKLLLENNVPTSNDFGLHKAKQPWKSRHLRKAKETDQKTAEREELYNETRSILNKLTPKKFQTLVSKMQGLPIDTENKLKGVVDLVFEWAVNMPLYSVAYANMSRCLSMFKVPSDSKAGEMVDFRALLLTRCQREFEKGCPSKKVLLAERRKEIEDATKKDGSSKEDIEYETAKAKRRSLGNIRFVGEMFKLKMLTENIMHDCLVKLLHAKDPVSLECSCRLLTIIGKKLDVEKAKPRMNQYFNQMSKIVNDKTTKPRVRFMLMDVMDLRTNKWVPRRVENNPKTIDRIQHEVAQKALISQQNIMAARSQGRGSGGVQGQNGGSKDGWDNVSSSRTPIKSLERSIDRSKMNMSKQNVDKSAIHPGQGGGANRFAGWGRGSTLNSAGIPLQLKEKTTPKPNNLSSHEPNTSTTWIKTLLDERDTERKTKDILNDYFAGQDFEKAVKCVRVLPSQNHLHFVRFAFRIVEDESSSNRKLTGQLMHDLIEHNVISVHSFIKGLEEVLNHAAFLKTDNPMIWQFYGELISPIIQDGTVLLCAIKLAAKTVIEGTKELDVLDEITGGAVKRERFYEACLTQFMTT